MDKIYNEIKILSSFKSENIVKYYHSFIEKDNFNIFMEYCDSLDLKAFIDKHKKDNTYIEPDTLYLIVLNLCLGIKEIHNKNIIHRDLKPENIFINKDNKIKIGDFGISKQLNKEHYAKTFVGTCEYMAPELLKGKEYTKKVDIWSLGTIIYELCTLEYCYDCGENLAGLINKICEGEHGKIDSKKYSSILQKIIDSSLNKNYKERPNIEEILEMVYKCMEENKNI